MEREETESEKERVLSSLELADTVWYLPFTW